MIFEPISMSTGVHAVGNILYCFYKRQQAEGKTLVSIKAGAGSNTRKIRVRDRHIELAHLGCGTPLGIPTHFSAQMLIFPERLIEEVNNARKSFNEFHDPWSRITCDPDALIVTDFHRAWSQIFEMMSDETCGTCGSGAGRAYYYASILPESAIYARDLTDLKLLTSKLMTLKNYVKDAVRNLKANDSLSEEDRARFTAQQSVIEDIGGHRLRLMANQFFVLGKWLKLRPTKEVLDEFDGNAVVEFSHGVLSDREKGFKPYVSSMRTLPQFFDDYLKKIGYKGEIKRVAVVCAYDYRHGPGPMPTYDENLRDFLGIAKAPDENRWRGPIRCGNLDIVQIQYAIKCCGGAKQFDGVWLTCFDQILSSAVKNPYIEKSIDPKTKLEQTIYHQTWDICIGYIKKGNVYCFKNKPGSRLTTKSITGVQPVISHYGLTDQTQFKDNKGAIYDFLAPIVENLLGLPLKAVSYGTSEKRKIWRK